MVELIGFRALQGVGAGGLMVRHAPVVGELVSPRERGRYTGVIGAVMPVAMIGGPLVGGWITDPRRGTGSSTSTCRSAWPPWPW